MRKDIAGPEGESTRPMWESLEGAVREKAQEFIQQILEEEVTELLGREKSERGSVNVQTGAKHKTMPLRCRDCRKRFSVRIGTAMQDSNIPLQKWAVAIYLMTTNLKGVSSMKLHRDLGIAHHERHHAGRPNRTGPRRSRAPVVGRSASGAQVGSRRADRSGGERQSGWVETRTIRAVHPPQRAADTQPNTALGGCS